MSLGFASLPVWAHSYGPPQRVTAAPGDNARACTQCHAGTALNAGPGSVGISLQSGSVYIPGVKQRITVLVSDPGQQRWGFELSARLDSDPQGSQAGNLLSIDNFTQVICEDASAGPCPSGAAFIQHTTAGTRAGTKNGASFQFDWIPPATNSGTITLYVAGNAANGDGGSGGDRIYTTSVQLSPLSPVAPTVNANNIVSAATATSVPFAPNSWVTVYGSNLGVTTRSWSEADFVDDGFPTSLDGVSVVLNAFGAPRRAYVGFVSPGQVNFLLPSDTNATTVQVQIKNPAGITTPLPITVQSNAPQLLTLDGKYVTASHADGNIVAKPGSVSSLATTAAAPGETITIYATGCGATSPALIPGQRPAQAASLTTLPQVTIAGTAAIVVSGAVLPGTGGVYQIKVQVPATATNGDLPLIAQLGAAASVPVLITVQR